MADDRIDDPTVDHAAMGQVTSGPQQAGRGPGDLPVDPDLAPSDVASSGLAPDVARSDATGSRPRGRARVRYLSRRLRRMVRRRWDILAVIAAGGASGAWPSGD
jgi:hypothetical protein